MNYAGDQTLARLADEKMNMLGHDDITGDDKTVAPPHSLQRVFEEIPSLSRTQTLKAVETTESKEVKTSRVLVSDQAARHRREEYNESTRKSKNRTAKVCAVPGAQKRGTWGNPRWWGTSPRNPGTW